MESANIQRAVGCLEPAARALLRELVGMNSFTANPAGVRANASRIAAAFAPLGFSAEFVPSAAAEAGDHLFMRLGSDARLPTLALLSHLDTVYPPDEEIRNDFRWREDAGRIYGPGTSDIKGGTAAIWLLLAAVREADPGLLGAANWVVAMNAREEVDSQEFGARCRERFPAGTRAVLIFEADGTLEDAWGVVAARKGRATFTVRVEGRSAHAGGQHAHGANAIVQLSLLLPRLAALTDEAAGVTVNVGTIRGGTVNNRVPHAAESTLEMRAFDPARFAETREAILAFAGPGEVRSRDGHACQVSVTLDDYCASWPRNGATDDLVAVWRGAAGELGQQVVAQERGGLSDGNVLWRDFPTLDGLGPRGGDEHCSEWRGDGSKTPEWLDARSLVPKTVLNARAIARLLRGA